MGGQSLIINTMAAVGIGEVNDDKAQWFNHSDQRAMVVDVSDVNVMQYQGRRRNGNINDGQIDSQLIQNRMSSQNNIGRR